MSAGFHCQELLLVALFGATFLLSACISDVSVDKLRNAADRSIDGRLSEIAQSALPSPTVMPQFDIMALVNTKGARANLRSGPGLEFPIVDKANPNAAFEVVGRSEDKKWWQICCVKNADGAEPGAFAWLSGSVVQIQGDPQSVTTTPVILTDDLTAQWAVNWRCVSTQQRCTLTQCAGTVGAVGDNPSQQPWLKVDYAVAWEDSCASSLEAGSWAFEINKYTGEERSQAYTDNFLYNYWLGADSGAGTHLFTMDDGRKVLVQCSSPQTQEVEESEGWTTVYEGRTCHDVHTGILVTLSYTKKWLYTGEGDGQTYKRAFFGDFELLEQYLVDSSEKLYYIDE